jgi:hypothetical protein
MKIMDIGKKMDIAPGTPWYVRVMLHGAKWELRIRAFCVILWRSLVSR